MTLPSRFTPFTEAQLDEHEARLQRIAATIFYDAAVSHLELDPTTSQIHLGMYLSARRLPHKVRKQRPHADAKREHLMQFLLSVDEQPLSITAAATRTDPGDVDYDVRPWTPSGAVRIVPLFHYSQLVDFSEDSTAELRASGLPESWVRAFGELTLDSRRVFKSPLAEIRYIPPALHKLKPTRYVRMLAAHGTYETLFGGYFPKWREGRERQGPTPATFSDEFLRATTDEVLLAKGHDYLMVASGTSYQLFQIVDTGSQHTLREVLGGHDTAHGDLDWKEPRTVVLFHAVDGSNRIRERAQQVYVPEARTGYRLLLDPRGMVEDLATVDGASLLKLRDSFDWFVEMCATHFRQPFQAVDLSLFEGLIESPSFLMLKRELDATVRLVMDGLPHLGDFTAELTAERRQRVEALLARPGVLVFTQGMPLGSARVVGVDPSWLYLRDMGDGSVYALHLGDFIRDWRISVIAQQVYAGTRGVIPLVVGVFALGALALAGPALIPAASAITVRAVVRELTVRQVTTMAAKRVAKFLAPALAAEMTVLVLDLFDRGDDDSDRARRWKAFAEGFFHGYVVQTLYDEFFSKFKLSNLPGPKEYRAVMLVKRAYQAIDKVREVVNTLEAELDEAAVKRGLVLFERAMTRSVKGSILLLSLLYYVHEDDMGAIVDGYAGPVDAAAPDADTWHFESAQQISVMARNLLRSMQDATGQAKDFLDTLRGTESFAIGAAVFFTTDAKHLAADVVKAMGRATGRAWDRRPDALKKAQQKAVGALTHPTVLKVLGGIVLASGVLHEVLTKGAGTKAVGATLSTVYDVALEPLLSELVTQWPGSTPTRAKIHGELTGGLLGAFMFNRFLLGSKDEVEAAKAADHPHLGQRWLKLVDGPWGGSLLSSKLKIGFVGPLIKVILKRYLSLFEQVKRHGHFRDREHTMETLGQLLTIGEDAALSRQRLERLAKFRTHEESVSFSLTELVKILFRLRTTIGADLADYLKERHQSDGLSAMDFLPVEVERLASAAETLGLPELVETYSRELYVVVSMHFVAALNELEAALADLFEPFTRPGLKQMGWMELLSELGFDVGDLSAVVDEFDAAARDRLTAFQGSGAP